MGEPIHLPDGRIAYGKAQEAVMRATAELTKFVAPLVIEYEKDHPLPARPVIEDADILTVGDDRYKEAVALAGLFPSIPPAVSFQAVQGIGPQIERALYDAGFSTWADVMSAGAEEIDRRISGIGLNRARALYERAQRGGQ